VVLLCVVTFEIMFVTNLFDNKTSLIPCALAHTLSMRGKPFYQEYT